ncbi:hypothetical protein HanRHA438_Chr04g0179111 [Helianthus annuus]|nr:hypothetical protein HanRHA438_Chr04g0179111 [Helianthus annuus]
MRRSTHPVKSSNFSFFNFPIIHGNLLIPQSTRLNASKLLRLPRKDISSVNEHERRHSVRSLVECSNTTGSNGIPILS